MKKPILLIATLLMMIHIAGAQSKTFKTLRHKFGDAENVHSFSASGFWARTILWMAGEHEFKDAIEHLDDVRVITIPSENFRKANVTPGGLKKLVLTDAYEEMLVVKEHGDEITFYIQEGDDRNNRYFLLVDGATEVVAIEFEGFIDVDKISKHTKLTSDNDEL
jgi:hypothetical protein